MFSLFKKRAPEAAVACVVPAAGAGSRMGGHYGDGKQLIDIGGVPLLVHTLTALQQAELIDTVVVAARPEELPEIARLVGDFALTKVAHVVCGGASRMSSVALGMAALAPGYTHIAIHDGARPCCPPELIDAVVREALEYGAAIAALPPKDTVWREKDGRLGEELDRAALLCAQTPQVFPFDAFDAAIAYAMDQDKLCTDDASVYALLNKPVRVVPGDVRNIKVTTPEDLPVAQLFLTGSAEF
ncbi:MAG: 2-C-methyl-D-erythritol 4-phosphate cytidylyltransferase [Clostridiales bacterium]|nr:2-C-methyl-D-erythritol 4-phosphate cytidylyltransferase [Clostridiales bacterium]